MAGTYKLVHKDGDYGYNTKTGDYGIKDFVLETEDLAEALRTFLEYTEGEYDDDEDVKVTLTFRHKSH